MGFGGAKRDRTADLNTASVALSQLSYGPKLVAVSQRGRILGSPSRSVNLLFRRYPSPG